MDRYLGKAAAPTEHRPVHPMSIGTRTALLWNLPGFGPLTRIDTEYGNIPAQTLRVRDRVRLRSGRFSPILRIDRLLLDQEFIERNPGAQPLLIEPGRLGIGLPAEPVLLSPGQKLSDHQRLPASFCTARDLMRAGMAHRRPERFLTYVVFSFPEPEDVCSCGLWLRVDPPDPSRYDDEED